MSRRRRTLAAAVLAAVTLTGCGLTASGETDDSQVSTDGADPAGEVSFSTDGWKTDFSEHSVPLTEFRSGGPPRDGIPPLDNPSFVSQERAAQDLDPSEPVAVVEIGDEARAYPIRILTWHEIVNDELGGTPISVTFCPLCNSTVAFDRRVGGRTMTFGTTGNLRRSDLVMWDRQTESWWQQITAEAVVGELTGTKLEVLASQILSFTDFRKAHPEGEVLSQDTGFDRSYGENPYAGYDTNEGLVTGDTPDRTLPAKARVSAVKDLAERPIVYPFARLRDDAPVNDRAGGTDLVVFYDSKVRSALDETSIPESRNVGASAVYRRRLGERTLTFTQGSAPGRFNDRQTGSEWDLTGRAIRGELKGRQLEAIPHDDQFWFALAAFFDDPDIRR
ncbi:MAG: DUF3179 domain-containing protein [Solirubrobacterales bacterium]